MEQMLVPRRFVLFLDLVAAAAIVNGFLPFAMAQVLIDLALVFRWQEVGQKADSHTRDDFDGDEGEGHVPLAFDVAKKNGQGLVAAGDENGEQSAKAQMSFDIQIAADDRNATLWYRAA